MDPVHLGSHDLPSPRGPGRTWLRIALWGLLPLAALFELLAGERQVRAVPSDAEWHGAAERAVLLKRPEDSIVVAPSWADSLGRRAVGEVSSPMPIDARLNLRTLGRSDLATVPRVLELSVRGKDLPELAPFRLSREERFGRVALRIFENPAPEVLLEDLVPALGPTARVYRVTPTGAREDCRYEPAGDVRMPSLAGGPALPPSRWICPPGEDFIAASVLTDLTWRPRRCITLPLQGLTRNVIEFPRAVVGRHVVAYMGVEAFTERQLLGAPILLQVAIDGQPVGELLHRDGDGWVRGDFDTTRLSKTEHVVSLVAFATEEKAFPRPACVAAELRD